MRKALILALFSLLLAGYAFAQGAPVHDTAWARNPYAIPGAQISVCAFGSASATVTGITQSLTIATATVSGSIPALIQTGSFIKGSSFLVTQYNQTFQVQSVIGSTILFIVPNGLNFGTAGSGTFTFVLAPQGSICSPTVSIYSDIALSQLITQPLTSDGLGNFTFYAISGIYQETICATGLNCSTYPIYAVSSTASFKILNTVYYASQFCPGGITADIGACINAAIAALPTVVDPATANSYSAGIVKLDFVGRFNQSTTVSSHSPFVSIIGPGTEALQITCTVTGGDCWSLNTSPFTTSPSGTFGGFSLMGTSGASTNGFHVGDMLRPKFRDLYVGSFTGTSSVGWKFDDHTNYTEGVSMRDMTIFNSTTDMKFSNTGGVGDFSYFDIHNMLLATSPGQNGLVFDDQAAPGTLFLYHSHLGIAIENNSGNTSSIYWYIGNNVALTYNEYEVFMEDQNNQGGSWLTIGNAASLTGCGIINANSFSSTKTVTIGTTPTIGTGTDGCALQILLANSFSASSVTGNMNIDGQAATQSYTSHTTDSHPNILASGNRAGTFCLDVQTSLVQKLVLTCGGTGRGFQWIADQGNVCTNGELALSAGWQSTGAATVTAAAGTGQTCSWTITTGTTTAAAPTITDTLTNPLPNATTVCEMNIHGGTHTPAAGEGFTQTALSATAPIFTFIGTPTNTGATYFVTRRCGP